MSEEFKGNIIQFVINIVENVQFKANTRAQDDHYVYVHIIIIKLMRPI